MGYNNSGLVNSFKSSTEIVDGVVVNNVVGMLEVRFVNTTS